jgi:adenylate cyclase
MPALRGNKAARHGRQNLTKRRLAAIMFTDMVGYTSLGQKNEDLSLALVKEQQKLLRPIFKRNQGREIKEIGDGFLVEFASALNAARCAFEIQRATREFNIPLADDKRLYLRVGVHLGEIVQTEKGDIFGDAVNLASRIESLAEDGGVCLTRQVYDQIQNKLELPVKSLGYKTLKNVKSPIEVYRMVMPWEEEAAGGKVQSLQPKREQIDRSRLDPRRVAVLPFYNMSADPAEEYFADGLTEEVISTISRIQQLRTISRTSVMRYKKATKSLGEIGRELGVGSILEGSVRKSGGRIRVSAQLIDVESDEDRWSQNYDRNYGDIFAIQSDIATNVAQFLKVRLVDDEKNRIERIPTKSSEAHTLYLKGRYFWGERSEKGLERAISYFEKAIEKDKNYALAYVGIADCYVALGDHGYYPLAEAASKAKAFAKKALNIDNSLAEAHASLGAAFSEAGETEAAAIEKKRAIELNPNYATAHHWLAITLLDQHKIDEAISEAKKARELDPLSTQIGSFLGALYYCAGRQDDAQRELQSCLELEPNFIPAHVWLTFVFAEKRMFREAVGEAEKLLALSPRARSLSAAAYAFAVGGRMESARKIYADLVTKSDAQYVSPIDLAIICTGMGRFDEAISWLRKADEQSQLHGRHLVQKWCGPLRKYKWFRELFTDVDKDTYVRKLQNLASKRSKSHRKSK